MKDGIKTNSFGNQYWKNKKGDYHRLNNLPAIIRKNGYKAYYLNGVSHRTNGPTFLWNNGSNDYHINGIRQNNPDKETLWIHNINPLTTS